MPTVDDQILAAVSGTVATIPDVVAVLQAIDHIVPDSDGLKWFNWLYLTVTCAVRDALPKGAWHDSEWLSLLDVRFASLYFGALRARLTPSGQAPKCWQVLFDARHDSRLARIQFALAGINAHINHDLAPAIVSTCEKRNVVPIHGSDQYRDYSAINEVLDPIVDVAKKELLIGLLGEDLPSLNLVERLVAGWSIRTFREIAWTNGEVLWTLRAQPVLSVSYLAALDGTGELSSRGLLAPVGV